MILGPELPIVSKVDASGLNCPLPLLRAKQALAKVDKGQVIEVIATDPSAMRDFLSFTRLTKHRLLDVCQTSGCFTFFIEKG